MARKLMLSLKFNDETQCHKLFHTSYTIQGSLCDLIIDSGIQENIIIRKGVVERL